MTLKQQKTSLTISKVAFILFAILIVYQFYNYFATSSAIPTDRQATLEEVEVLAYIFLKATFFMVGMFLSFAAMYKIARIETYEATETKVKTKFSMSNKDFLLVIFAGVLLVFSIGSIISYSPILLGNEIVADNIALEAKVNSFIFLATITLSLATFANIFTKREVVA